MKTISIDYLYLDNSTCSRCKKTETNLEQAIVKVSQLLEMTGRYITLNKIQMTSPELAIAHHFISSPTIRVNGVDLGFEQKENVCTDCGDLCDTETTCRVWVLEGKEYDVPPSELLIERILSIVFGSSLDAKKQYQLPNNLVKFYNGVQEKEVCCDTNCCS